MSKCLPSVASPYRCRAVVSSPLPGSIRLALWFDGDALASIDFVEDSRPLCNEAAAGVVQAMESIAAYFLRPADVKLPSLRLVGTNFQLRVWQALCAIPCGETLSYGALANRLGSSARAVAGACRANPVPLLIPCHRVVAANGPGGYMGQTAGKAMAIKQWLLLHENVGLRCARADVNHHQP